MSSCGRGGGVVVTDIGRRVQARVVVARVYIPQVESLVECQQSAYY